MFPLSFSSSSSLSSIPPSLDSISELDHGLSDISEDDDRIVETETSHPLWSLPQNTFSVFSSQQLADLEHLVQNPPSPLPVSTSQTCSSELLKFEEGCEAVTRTAAGLANWRHWLCAKGVVKCLSFILCFLSALGQIGSRCHPTKLFSGLSKKLSIFTPKLQMPAAKLNYICKYELTNLARSTLHPIHSSVVPHWAHIVAFLIRLSSKFIKKVTSLPSRPTSLHLPSVSFFACPRFLSSSSLSAFPSLPFSFTFRSSLPSLASFCRSNSSAHRYLLNPSPLSLPILLVLFLLAVMLTARQSVVFALILATPLGLTLFYLESAVSSQRKTVLPTFVDQRPNDQAEMQLSSALSPEAPPPTPTRTPPYTRHHVGTTWMQEMCDPAA